MRILGNSPTLALRAACLFTALLLAARADAQLRVVTYNTATAHPVGPANPGRMTAPPVFATVFEAIANEMVGGIAKPIDVLLLQEQWTTSTATQSIVDILNGIYGPGVYARGTVDGQVADPQNRAGRPGVVYNTQTVQLLSELAFGNVGSSHGDGDPALAQQPRSTLRYEFQPVGYDESAIFYAYNSHYLSGTGININNRRLAEATSIRAHADALGEGVHIIYAGDYNIATSSGTAYTKLLSAGNGQAFDPIDTPGSWGSNANFSAIHTQSPATVAQFPGQTVGGLDDRFDFQHVTGELLDGEGMSYITGSYRAFGNNNTHGCCNNPITASDGNGQPAPVLQALMESSDHLPVVADYQLPAKMGVEVDPIPLFVKQGSSSLLDLTVSNIAPAVHVLGVDELDYTISVLGGWGSVVGAATGIDFALGGGSERQIALNTSTLGGQSGLLQVTTDSQGAAGALFELPISFTVIADFLEADFNEDGFVDGADLAFWEANFGATGAVKADGDANADGWVDGRDFLTWQRQVGLSPTAIIAGEAVPEPATALLLIAGCAAVCCARKFNFQFPPLDGEG